MKNNFQLIHVGGPYGDCSSDYETSFDKPFKVKDLLSIIEAQKDEWGNIYFLFHIVGLIALLKLNISTV